MFGKCILNQYFHSLYSNNSPKLKLHCVVIGSYIKKKSGVETCDLLFTYQVLKCAENQERISYKIFFFICLVFFRIFCYKLLCFPHIFLACCMPGPADYFCLDGYRSYLLLCMYDHVILLEKKKPRCSQNEIFIFWGNHNSTNNFYLFYIIYDRCWEWYTEIFIIFTLF